jgi:hypothetical protein
MQIGKRGKIHIQEDGRIIGLVRSTPLPWDDAKLQPRTEEIRRGLSKLSCEATVVCGVNRDGKVVDYRVFSTLQESETRCDPGAIRQMLRAERPDGALVAHSHPSGLLTPSGPEIRA